MSSAYIHVLLKSPDQAFQSNAELYAQLRSMEEKLKAFQDMLPHLGGLASQRHSRSFSDSDGRSWNPARAFSNSVEPDTRDSRDSTAVTDDHVDGMGIMLRDGDRDFDAEVGYFGISSNIILLRRVSQAFVQHFSSTNINRPTNAHSTRDKQQRSYSAAISRPDPQTRTAHVSPESQMDKYHLPPLDEGMALIRQYFGTVGLMTPTFHEPHFVDYFQQAVVNQKCDRNISTAMLAILNTMFAFGIAVATTSSPAYQSPPVAQSEIYYLRAIALMGDNFAPSTLETVQLSLILSTYLMGTQRSVKSWNFHALAVAGALKLGLHSRKAGKPLPMLVRELRKRTWFWCVTNDRTLSMLFGRPPMIHQSLVRLDLPEDLSTEYPSNTSASFLMRSITDRYNAFIELTTLIGEAIKNLYNENLDSELTINTFELIASTVNLNWKLAQWRQSLPQGLKPITSHEVRPENAYPTVDFLRMRLFLTFQYLNTVILVNRAVLFKYLDYSPKSDPESCEIDLLRNSGRCDLQACLKATKDLIETAAVLLTPAKGLETVTLNGAWYFNCYYVFNAALTILGIMLVCKSPSFTGLFDLKSVTEMEKSLEQAGSVLNGLHNGNPMILRCWECLERLIRMYGAIAPSNGELPSPSMGERMETPGLLMNYPHQPQDYGVDNGFNVMGQDMRYFDMTADVGQSAGGMSTTEDFDFIDNFYQMMPQ